jgi:signal transduction histidine kinase
VAGATGIALVSRDEAGSPAIVAGRLDVDPAVLASAEVAAVLDSARDSAVTRVSPPVGDQGSRRALLVASVHRRDDGGVDPTSLSVTERRSTATGWVVASVDPGAIVAAHLPPSTAATVRDGTTELQALGGDPPPPRAPEVDVEVGAREWVISAGDPSEIGWAREGIAAIAGSVVLAGLVAGLVDRTRRGRDEAQREAALRMDQLRLIGEIAPVVQQSLRLDEVLPVAAVQLTDQFGLEGVAISVPGPDGRPLDLFSMGRPPDPAEAPTLRPPRQIEPGQTLAMALEREGRTVAQLRIVAGEPLDSTAMDSLRAVSELIAAAIVNTTLYRSQQEAVRRLRELDELKTTFLGTASHELRTPATAISGFASLLTSNWSQFPEDQKLLLANRIAANARSLDTLVQDLLDFSRLERGTLRVNVEPLDLGGIVSRVVERLTPALGDHAIEAALGDLPPVAGDVNGVERILTNLLTNAAKYSPDGTTIRLSTLRTARGADIVVDDEGPGVPADERRLIFTRFFRGKGEGVVRTRGVGIGLSVVKEFADQMGVSVDVGEAPGGGARFTVSFLSASGGGAANSTDGDEKEASSAATP